MPSRPLMTLSFSEVSKNGVWPSLARDMARAALASLRALGEPEERLKNAKALLNKPSVELRRVVAAEEMAIFKAWRALPRGTKMPLLSKALEAALYAESNSLASVSYACAVLNAASKEDVNFAEVEALIAHAIRETTITHLN